MPVKSMALKQLLAVAMLCSAPFVAAQNTTTDTVKDSAKSHHGTVPRAAVTDYVAHEAQENIQIGAVLLAKKDLKKALATDINQCCLVVEVAFYPAKDNFVRISMDDFTLREAGMDLGTRPSTADALAARLEQFPVKPDREHTPGLSRSSDIGYERTGGTSPTDQAGNQQSNRGGVYQRDSVGIGIPVGGRSPSGPASTNDGAAAAAGNRQAIQAELTEKGLPEVDAWEPVAGYLYFSVPKKSKNGYELVYMMGDKKVVLALK
jgi:hypothetical protein